MPSIDLYLFTASYTLAVVILCIAHPSWQVGMCVVVILGSAILISMRARISSRDSTVILLGLVVALIRISFVTTELANEFKPLIDSKQTLTGTIVALPDLRETSTRITISVKKNSDTTRIIATVPSYPELHVGDIVRVTGTLTYPEPFETDGGRVFAYDDFLSKDGVFAIIQRAHAERVGSSKNPWLLFLRILEHSKNTFIRSIELSLPDPQSALAAGIIVGGKQGLGDELIEAFTEAGMLQLVVLSGYNVMIVADLIMRILSTLPKKVSLTLASLSIICFVLIAGAGASALRAGVMALFSMYSRTTKKPYVVLRVLTLTFFILGVLNPLMLVYDPGFQFSCIATLGLILGVPHIEPRLTFLRSPLLIELFSTTLAAEICLLPFLLWQTGHLSVVSLFANIAATPVMPFCMGASAFAAVVAIPFGYISDMIPLLSGLPAYLTLTYVLKIATVSAALPFASYGIPVFPFWVVIVSYLSMGMALVWSSKNGLRNRRPFHAP